MFNLNLSQNQARNCCLCMLVHVRLLCVRNIHTTCRFPTSQGEPSGLKYVAIRMNIVQSSLEPRERAGKDDLPRPFRVLCLTGSKLDNGAAEGPQNLAEGG